MLRYADGRVKGVQRECLFRWLLNAEKQTDPYDLGYGPVISGGVVKCFDDISEAINKFTIAVTERKFNLISCA
jgi:hypothetical protein